MRTKVELLRNIYNPNTNKSKVHRNRKHTQYGRDYSQETVSYTSNEREIILANYTFETYRHARDEKTLFLRKNNLSMTEVQIDLALGVITKNVIDALEITSESKQREIFEQVKKHFIKGICRL
ncbi:hypothetical protein [Legionella tunisiensis]|uniref:hypothetical protein n=1 Tax=Legionella tunisiensis TaxID=1034944 RepID=UPI000368FDAE|nr:hypothetical protein [Legionella tunisiensis]